LAYSLLGDLAPQEGVMYSRILVAVDGSATSDRALVHAVDLARESGAALRIAHVVDMGWATIAPELAIDLRSRAEAVRAEGRAVMEAALAIARDAGQQAESMLLETSTPLQHVPEAIVDAAIEWRADLLVLGTHGRKGVERLLLGSVADGVVRHSPMPVLLMPPHAGPAR